MHAPEMILVLYEGSLKCETMKMKIAWRETKVMTEQKNRDYILLLSYFVLLFLLLWLFTDKYIVHLIPCYIVSEHVWTFQ